MDIVAAWLEQDWGYHASLLLLLVLIATSARKISELRWVFALFVFLTIGMWYYVDVVYNVEVYERIEPEEFQLAYLQISIFLIAFALLLQQFLPRTPTETLKHLDLRVLGNTKIVSLLVLVWLVLFCIGIFRANFRVLEVLFPVGARASWGAQMWARPRVGGGLSFLISAGDYTYSLVCALFGVIAVSIDRPKVRLSMIFMMLLTWPMFILEGARSKVIMVALPAIVAALMLTRWRAFTKIAFLAAVGLIMNFIMLMAINYRNVGMEDYLEAKEFKTRHLGLNMLEELVYLNDFQGRDAMPVEWGGNYWANLVNVVPRTIWPGKPEVGVDYAILRGGLHNGQLMTTFSQGLVGQGVTNFGRWLGPLAPAIILACFGWWVCRLPLRGNRFLRACLVLVSLSAIPNFGRDITAFTAWPIIFGALGVYVIEAYFDRGLASSVEGMDRGKN